MEVSQVEPKERARNGFRIPIATKLSLSFLVVIVIISAVFIVIGIRLIGDRIVAEAQEKTSPISSASQPIDFS
jgi:hypothetical protein